MMAQPVNLVHYDDEVMVVKSRSRRSSLLYGSSKEEDIQGEEQEP